MLRRNRMKPIGSASRKKLTSSEVSERPEQPAMKQRGPVTCASLVGDYEALTAGGLEARAERVRILARERRHADAVPRPAVDVPLGDRGGLAAELGRKLVRKLLVS